MFVSRWLCGRVGSNARTSPALSKITSRDHNGQERDHERADQVYLAPIKALHRLNSAEAEAQEETRRGILAAREVLPGEAATIRPV